MSFLTKKLFTTDGLQQLGASFIKAHRRFPLTLLSSLCATITIIYVVTESITDIQPQKLFVTFLLGIPLLFGIEFYNERKRIHPLIPIAVAIGYLVYFYFFSKPIDTKILLETPAFRIEIIAMFIAFHLFVSVSPYIFYRSVSGFWHYNKTLFLTILTAFLYSGTLTIGLILATEGIKNLFEIHISNDVYVYIWFGLNGYFNTLFFVSRLPSLQEIDEATDYPIGLKYFTQYVLLPLVAIYLVILLAYEFKIVVQWSLPKGWVSLMVLASAVFGILAFLLLFPLQKISRWVLQFTRIYYWILLPLVLLMMVAIYVRFTQYGLTEPRYFVALLSVWLLGISLYFVISKVDNIKVVPLSLFIVALLGVYGPFNAFYSSKKNQEKRFYQTIKANDLLKNGKLVVPKNFSFSTKKEADSFFAAAEYLTENQENELKPILSETQFSELKKTDIYNKFNRFCELTSISRPIGSTTVSYFEIEHPPFETLERADYLIRINFPQNQKITIESNEININMEGETLLVKIAKEEVKFNLKSLVSLSGNNLPIEKLTFRQSVTNWQLRLVIENCSSDNGKITYLNGSLFLTKK